MFGHGMRDWFQFMRLMSYQPNAQMGAHARKSQKKRRLNQRRRGGKKSEIT